MPAKFQKATDHFADLAQAYHAVAERTWGNDDFLEANLESSRSLYTPDSLNAGHPRPRELEVYALLSGLPFHRQFADALVGVQRQISGILGDHLHYWVAPANLGVEYCVFKWPTEAWIPDQRPRIEEALETLRYPAFQFDIGGIQINPDGCVVAKGFDHDAVLFRIRNQLKAELPFMPERQSGWAHVPLGRILEPIGTDRFAQLRVLINEIEDREICSTVIDSLKFVHETRWYMESKTILANYALAPLSLVKTPI
jgi:hypothetical protein